MAHAAAMGDRFVADGERRGRLPARRPSAQFHRSDSLARRRSAGFARGVPSARARGSECADRFFAVAVTAYWNGGSDTKATLAPILWENDWMSFAYRLTMQVGSAHY